MVEHVLSFWVAPAFILTAAYCSLRNLCTVGLLHQLICRRIWNLSSLTDTAHCWILIVTHGINHLCHDLCVVWGLASWTIVRFVWKLVSLGKGNASLAKLAFVLQTHAIVRSGVGCNLVVERLAWNHGHSSTLVTLVDTALDHIYRLIGSKTFKEMRIVYHWIVSSHHAYAVVIYW